MEEKNPEETLCRAEARGMHKAEHEIGTLREFGWREGTEGTTVEEGRFLFAKEEQKGKKRRVQENEKGVVVF